MFSFRPWSIAAIAGSLLVAIISAPSACVAIALDDKSAAVADMQATPPEPNGTKPSASSKTKRPLSSAHRPMRRMGGDLSNEETAFESADFRYLPDDQRLPREMPHFFVPHHTGGDWVPDVAAPPSFVAPDGVSRYSQWGGDLGPDDIVLIPKGSTVIYDGGAKTRIKAIGVRGSLQFATDRSTALAVGTLLIYETGRLFVGVDPQGVPSRAGVKTTIVFDGAIDTAQDPGRLGIGLIAVGGQVRIEGAEIKHPFGRLASTARAGLRILELDAPVDWKAGDRLLLADTQIGGQRPTFKPQWEEVKIEQVRGSTVTLAGPPRHSHAGYVGHLTRSVVFRSAAGAGDGSKASAKARGHIILAGDTDVSIRNAAFVNLGRTRAEPLSDTKRDAEGRVICDEQDKPILGTNQRGRYAVHMHHLTRRAIVEGNVLDGALKWGFVVHGSHAELRRNVVVRFDGAAIASEDGNETGLIEGNLIVGTGGGSGVEDVTIVNVHRPDADANSFSHAGYGYWMSSPFMRLRDNIAAGEFRVAAFTYFLFGHDGMTLPMAEGARAELLAGIDPGIVKGRKFNKAYQPIVEFRGNLADLALGDGFLSYYCNSNRWAVDHFTARIRGLKNRGVIFFYSAPQTNPRDQNQALTSSLLLGPYALGLDPRGAPKRLAENWQGLSIGVDGNVEGATPIYNVRDSRIEGFYDGLLVAKGGGDVVRAKLKNFRNITIPGPAFPSTPTNIIDTVYAGLPNSQHPQENIYMFDDVSGRAAEIRKSKNAAQVRNWIGSRMDVRVTNYNGTKRDFQVYYRQQRPDMVIPLLEMTNREAQKRYNISIGDALAPAGREPKINGFVGPLAAGRPGIRYSETATSPDFDFHYIVKQTSLEKEPPPAVFHESLRLEEGLNFIPRTVAYNGSKFKTTFLIWGRFTKPDAVADSRSGAAVRAKDARSAHDQ